MTRREANASASFFSRRVGIGLIAPLDRLASSFDRLLDDVLRDEAEPLVAQRFADGGRLFRHDLVFSCPDDVNLIPV
jgi:hypothetical protein